MGEYAFENLLLFLLVCLYRFGIVVDVGGAGGMVGTAGGAVGGGHVFRTVIYAGLTPSLGLVAAMDAEPRLGGDDFAAFGASFECHNFSPNTIN